MLIFLPTFTDTELAREPGMTAGTIKGSGRRPRVGIFMHRILLEIEEHTRQRRREFHHTPDGKIAGSSNKLEMCNVY